MDKYEYSLKLDQMKNLCEEENFDAAADIADTINWNKVKNANALVKAGEVYEKAERYSECRDVLLLAYDRSPIGRMIIYRLGEIAIKMKDYESALNYYEEFVQIAPHDNLRYVLKYNIKKSQGGTYEELIPILEELKEQEYTEEWAYELAYLYHKSGKIDKCIESCDELILWFGDGPYVERALELKMLYQPLTKLQEEKYRHFRQEREGITEINGETMAKAGEYAHETVAIPQVIVNSTKFNTVNLQEEIAKGMQQIKEATEKSAVEDTMDNIKKIVEDIPYLQMPEEEAIQRELEQMALDQEIDGCLKTNFQELLEEESDGQISLVVDEKAPVETQITGQMSIQDILDEWERTRRAAEAALQEADQKKLESAKARALQEAGDIMDKLNDVLPKLDAGVTPKELLEEEYMQNSDTEESKPQVTSPYGKIIEASEVLMEKINPEQKSLGQSLVELMPEAVDEFIDEMKMEEASGGETEISEEAETQEEAGQEISMEELAAEQPTGSESVIEEPAMEELATEELAGPEPATEEPEAQEEQPPMEELIPELDILPEIVLEEAEEEPEEEDLPEIDVSVFTGNSSEPVETKESISQTKELPNIKARQRTGRLPHIEIPLPEDLDTPQSKPERVKIKELSEEQKAIFSYFVPVKGMEDQIVNAINNLSEHLAGGNEMGTGNLIIQGEKGCGKTMLATSLIKVLQKEGGHPAGKIGKIDASSLNGKDVQQMMRKVSGGCLIIERAGDISRNTAVTLALLMKHDTAGTLIILEDTSKGIKNALSKDEAFAAQFKDVIKVPIFTNDELVTFARSYSNELGYKIDDMAVLALYNRISNIQRLDQATTLTEVKELVDEAIEREAHSGLRKAISILTAKRYTEDDKIVLTEANFDIK